jgi:hypothetical protein
VLLCKLISTLCRMSARRLRRCKLDLRKSSRRFTSVLGSRTGLCSVPGTECFNGMCPDLSYCSAHCPSQSWLLSRYPMQKSTRAKLVRLYYELCLVPGIEPRVLRSWADMLSRLLANKPGIKPKLDATDLSLPWKPLWRILQKELWPKSTLDDSTYVSYYRTTLYLFINTFRRNLVNILLYLADQCKRYYSPQEIPLMLETFLPLLTKEV